jgi:thymidine phosphorylase
VIDPGVGVELMKKIGDVVEPNEPILRIHYTDMKTLEAAEARLKAGIDLADSAPSSAPMIIDRISR